MSEWLWWVACGAVTFVWGWKAGRAALARRLAMALLDDPLCMTRLVREHVAEAQRKEGDA